MGWCDHQLSLLSLLHHPLVSFYSRMSINAELADQECTSSGCFAHLQ